MLSLSLSLRSDLLPLSLFSSRALPRLAGRGETSPGPSPSAPVSRQALQARSLNFEMTEDAADDLDPPPVLPKVKDLEHSFRLGWYGLQQDAAVADQLRALLN